MVENDRIHSLFRHFPLLFSLVKKLNENKIDFVISGSACLYVFGNERFPLDLDIFLKNKDHDLADKIFDIKSFSFSSDFEVVRNSNPFGDSAFQLTSNLMLLNSKQTLDFSINDNILKNRVEAEYGGEKVFFMPPEEVLLTKSFLNRGPDVGKHDAEDIKNFLKVHKNLNTGYIASRLEDLNIKNRLNDFKYCDLLFKINKKDMEKNESKKDIKPEHYYGDVVRKIFMLIASIMVGSYPVYYEFIKLPHIISVLAVITVVILAGLQNPMYYGIAVINTLASIAGFTIFELRSISIYLNPEDYTVQFFFVNETLAVLFMLALYFCSKTLRGMYFNKRSGAMKK